MCVHVAGGGICGIPSKRHVEGKATDIFLQIKNDWKKDPQVLRV